MSNYFIVCCFLLSILITACQQSDSQVINLRQDEFIQVYFNSRANTTEKYTDPYRKIERPGDNLEAVIIQAIENAQFNLDLAVLELNLPKIAQALAKKARAGIRVRVILDNDYSLPLSELSLADLNKFESRDRLKYQEFLTLVDTNHDGKLSSSEINQGDALVILRNAGIPILDDTADGSKGSGLMHHKFIVIDNKIVITGSANFTLSGIHGDFSNPQTRGNANNLLAIDNQKLAELFTQEFNYMWGDGVGGSLDSQFGLAKPYRPPQKVFWDNTTVEVQFSPTSSTQDWQNSSNGLIAKTISQATNSIDLALFVFSEQKLVDLIEQKQQQQIKIRGLFEPEFAWRYYSEVLDMLGVALSDRCKYEADNHPWQKSIQTVGIAQLPQGDKFHHKFAIVDSNTLITGSQNWSDAANNNNDETVLIIHNNTVAKHFQQQFNQLYSQAALGIPKYLSTKITKQQQQCSHS
jgi:phosphatidylserine/phosphatidylglycerophosphate/cardiolipin synthase-like enzyme